MDIDRVAIAKEIISRQRYITIATVSGDQPWNTPVTAAHDEHFNFYWTSWFGTQHSQNIRTNKNVFIVIFDSQARPGETEAVYIHAHAIELSDIEEIQKASALVYAQKGKNPRPPEHFLGDSLKRLYKASPVQTWISLDADVKEDFTKARKEISLL